MHGTIAERADGPAAMLPSLTALRAFAALAVVIHHTRPAWAHGAVIDYIGQVGWLGVNCFFILSGFVLMWGYDPATRDRTFFLRRAVRIYPLHWLCLAASIAAFATVRSPLAGYVGTPVGTVLNVLMLHDWVPGHPEIRQAWNGVSWTLSCELLFYLCSPVLFRFLLRLKSVWPLLFGVFVAWEALLALSVAGAHYHWDATMDFLAYHPVPNFFQFVLGASAAIAVRAGVRGLPCLWSLLLICVPIAAYCGAFPEQGGYRYGAVMMFLVMPGIVSLIAALADTDTWPRPCWLRAPFWVLLGEASYALYMTHALFLGAFTLLRNRFVPITEREWEWGEVATLVYVVAALAISVATYLWFERPVRRLLLRVLGAGRPAGGRAGA
jgi:hypothetical protein